MILLKFIARNAAEDWWIFPCCIISSIWMVICGWAAINFAVKYPPQQFTSPCFPGQVLVTQFGSVAFHTTALTLEQWLWCIFLGVGTLLWGQVRLLRCSSVSYYFICKCCVSNKVHRQTAEWSGVVELSNTTDFLSLEKQTHILCLFLCSHQIYRDSLRFIAFRLKIYVANCWYWNMFSSVEHGRLRVKNANCNAYFHYYLNAHHRVKQSLVILIVTLFMHGVVEVWNE